MCFPLPPSYASYVTDPAVRTAVDHILGSKSLKGHETLDWGELPDFHAAVLAAHQVRCDYASALQGLWDAVWPTAIDEAEIGASLEAYSISDMADWHELGFDANSLWDADVFTRAYTLGDSYVGLSVSLNLREAHLVLWFGDQDDNDLALDLLPSDDWNSELDETYGHWSTKALAPIRDGGVPLERLNAVANRALVAITG